MKQNLLVLAAFLFLFFDAYAQAGPGPGGVGNTSGQSSLQLWLRSSDLIDSYENGDRVTQWKDRSGASNDLFGSSRTAPFLNAVTYDSCVFVEFKGREHLQTAGVSSSFQPTEATIFLVKQGVFRGTSIAIAIDGWLNEMLLFNYNQYHHSASGSFTLLPHPCVRQIPEKELSIVCGVFGKQIEDLKYLVNGMEAPRSSMETYGRPWDFRAEGRLVTLGQRDQFVSSEFFVGGLLEVIVYNRKLTDQEIAKVEEYLQCSYGITPQSCERLSSIDCPSKKGAEPEDFPCVTELSYFPNPFSENLKIVGDDSPVEMDISIWDASGRLVYRKVVQDTEIDLSILSNGIYFIQSERGCDDPVQKVVKMSPD
ncbi:MAG: T9SS type A sorting domain-containing protein [Bacteroidota bacterium]